MTSDKPTNVARLAAQARLIAAYEEDKWPPRWPKPAEVVRYLMDQHGLKRADLVPLLGNAERADDILRGPRQLTLAMVQRLRTRFHLPADLLLPPAEAPAARRAKKTGGSLRIILPPCYAEALPRAGRVRCSARQP
jgi:HTH-type transcriptional regulator/antitoxin HigA